MALNYSKSVTTDKKRIKRTVKYVHQFDFEQGNILLKRVRQNLIQY